MISFRVRTVGSSGKKIIQPNDAQGLDGASLQPHATPLVGSTAVTLNVQDWRANRHHDRCPRQHRALC